MACACQYLCMHTRLACHHVNEASLSPSLAGPLQEVMGSAHALNELCYFAWSGFRPGYPAAAFDFRVFVSSSSPTSPGFVGTSSTLMTTPSRRVRPLRGLFCHRVGRELTLTCGFLFLCAAVASLGIGLALIGPHTTARDASAQGGSGFWWFLH